MSDLGSEAVRHLVGGPFGDLMLRPWFDRAAVRLGTSWYLPLSRLWAEALDGDGSVAGFRARTGVGGLPDPLVSSALFGLLRLRERLAEADARWEAALFHGEGSERALPEIEAARHRAAHALMAGRALFAPLKATDPLPALRLEIAGPAAAAARRQALGTTPNAVYGPADPPPAMTLSRAARIDGHAVQWIRFASPDAEAGTAWARVVTPERFHERDGASLVFAHGVAVESEYWRGGVDRMDALLDAGVRLILPEGPAHGRRRWPRWYGGEPVFGRGPVGLLDYFRAHGAELAALIAWARQSAAGPVAVGGISLGALTAQMAVGRCAAWPAACRPDAALLVVPGRSVLRVALTGALTGALGVPAALRAAGWTDHELDAWREMVEPPSPPGVDPERIVVVLGTADEVTLFDEGRALADAWGLPEGNRFLWPRGHFSTAIALTRETAPFERLAALLGRR